MITATIAFAMVIYAIVGTYCAIHFGMVWIASMSLVLATFAIMIISVNMKQ